VSALVQAKPPFTAHGQAVKDADGDLVIACDDTLTPCGLWKDRAGDELAVCDRCGRVQIRMDWAAKEQCGIEVNP